MAKARAEGAPRAPRKPATPPAPPAPPAGAGEWHEEPTPPAADVLHLDRLHVDDEHNPRIHSPAALEQMVASLVGFPEMLTERPLVVQGEPTEAGQHRVLGGNLRTKAKRYLVALPEAEKAERVEVAVEQRRAEYAAEEQPFGEVQEQRFRRLLSDLFNTPALPAKLAHGYTPAQVRRFILTDNGTFGDWDWGKLTTGEWGTEEEQTAWGLKDAGKGWGASGADDAEGFNDQGNDPKSQYGVIIECTDEGDQETTFNDLTEQGYTCRVVLV